jgi:uncharacterized protein (DUF2237 family)
MVSSGAGEGPAHSLSTTVAANRYHVRAENDLMIQLVEQNVLGSSLQPCSTDPLTGFFRDGCCRTGPEDMGAHTVCILLTAEFLEFSRARGNDLSTPMPEYGFAGLSPGDRWCLCAARWVEAFDAGHAPQVVMQATHARALDICRLEDLKAHAVAETH